MCALLALALLLAGDGTEVARAEMRGVTRVKLTRLGSPSELRLVADCDYVCAGEPAMNLPAGSEVLVRASGGELYVICGGVELYCGGQVRLMRCGGGGVRFQSPALANLFRGDLALSASGSSIAAVLHIPLEDYLCGVVGYEMSNSYPLEALKAQAVAARNYALRKMSTRAGKSYDLTDTSTDQVFRGYNSSQTRVIQAVRETAGLALNDGGSLASCYYTASNGGQTESTRNIWGSSLRYSVVKDDPYDLENASSRKKSATIARDGSDLLPSLEAALLEGVGDALRRLELDADGARIASIEAIAPVDPKYAAPSRLYRALSFELRVRAPRLSDGAEMVVAATVEVPTYGALEGWYGLSINSASNETVEVARDGGGYRVTFRRYGHGAGMSQRGAQTMAAGYGKDFSEILEFYYPGTALRQLSLPGTGYASPLTSGDAIATARARGAAQLYRDAEGADACAALADGLALNALEVRGARALVETGGLRAWLDVAALRDFAPAGERFEPALGERAILAADAALLELPAQGARTLETLLAGAPMTLLERSASWALAEAESGARGYLPAALLVPEGEIEPTATIEPTTTPEPTETIESTATVEPTATIEPTTTPEPTATIESTATVEPTATSEPTPKPTTTAPPTARPTATPTLVVEPTPRPTPKPTVVPAPTLRPDPTVVDRPLPTGSPLPTLEPARAPEGAEGMFVPVGTKLAYVNVRSGSTLTLRRGPSASAASVGALRRGTGVRILAFDDDWALVEAEGGARGFASQDYLSSGPVAMDQPVAEDVRRTPAPSEVPEDAGEMTIIDTDITFCKLPARTKVSAEMYKKNSATSGRVCTIPADARVTVTAYNDAWAYVKYGNRTGFVKRKYLGAAK